MPMLYLLLDFVRGDLDCVATGLLTAAFDLADLALDFVMSTGELPILVSAAESDFDNLGGDVSLVTPLPAASSFTAPSLQPCLSHVW